MKKPIHELVESRLIELLNSAKFDDPQSEIEIKRLIKESMDRSRESHRIIEKLGKVKGRYNTQNVFCDLMEFHGVKCVRPGEEKKGEDMETLKEKVEVKELRPGYAAKQMKRGTPYSAGYDLAYVGDETGEITIEPGKQVGIMTGIALSFESRGKVVGMIHPRSGLACDHGIVLANTTGIIDSDYQGEIIVVLRNTCNVPYVLKPGTRIAQLVVTPVYELDMVSVEEFSTSTERGEGGFGHTGVNV